MAQICSVHKIRDVEIMSAFGQNVRRLRHEKGFTQEQLAEECGISQVQIARIESGKLNTSISTVVAIARALQVNEGELFS